ncbi:helix-turn-helix domain-containing protein [Cellulophaga sp. 20_2_10]|uniref:helix-turn-helix domain-containing protein n=1 Tax=Cellulophaga sp. 20_2_10 TaxID=2942476 RepID=UPI00201ADB6A|nr:helix-turn-helix transcriptional regulator [Cellulophaga sp. 20_2_10]MCL5244330.1 helix-turn-helix domain-containing protein [Cellulophaga sp. 20_2_10]
MKLGDKLKKLRAERNLNLIELDKIYGVSYVQIGRYENNKAKPSAKTIFKLANALNIGIEELTNKLIYTTNSDDPDFKNLDAKYTKLKNLEVISKESKNAIEKIFDLVILESSINEAMLKK